MAILPDGLLAKPMTPLQSSLQRAGAPTLVATRLMKRTSSILWLRPIVLSSTHSLLHQTINISSKIGLTLPASIQAPHSILHAMPTIEAPCLRLTPLLAPQFLLKVRSVISLQVRMQEGTPPLLTNTCSLFTRCHLVSSRISSLSSRGTPISSLNLSTPDLKNQRGSKDGPQWSLREGGLRREERALEV